MCLVVDSNGAFHQRVYSRFKKTFFYKELSKSEEIFERF